MQSAVEAGRMPGFGLVDHNIHPGEGSTGGWFALAWGLLGTVLALQGETSHFKCAFVSSMGRRAGQPWLYPCVLAGSCIKGLGVTVTLGCANLGCGGSVTSRSRGVVPPTLLCPSEAPS